MSADQITLLRDIIGTDQRRLVTAADTTATTSGATLRLTAATSTTSYQHNINAALDSAVQFGGSLNTTCLKLPHATLRPLTSNYYSPGNFI